MGGAKSLATLLLALCVFTASCNREHGRQPDWAERLRGAEPTTGGPEPHPTPSERPEASGDGPAARGAPESWTETEKIETLIRRVEQLEDAVFIRNDQEHNCRAAAEHMRDKWQLKREQVATARDFIRLAATGSSISGRPYRIRFKDGREVNSADFLLAELQHLESGDGGDRPPADP